VRVDGAGFTVIGSVEGEPGLGGVIVGAAVALALAPDPVALGAGRTREVTSAASFGGLAGWRAGGVRLAASAPVVGARGSTCDVAGAVRPGSGGAT
jgi:hypothetical protein